MKVPCEQCPLIPICRHKTIGQLLNGCQPIYSFMTESNIVSKAGRFRYRMKLVRFLKPTKWKLSKKGYCVIPQERKFKYGQNHTDQVG